MRLLFKIYCLGFYEYIYVTSGAGQPGLGKVGGMWTLTTWWCFFGGEYHVRVFFFLLAPSDDNRGRATEGEETKQTRGSVTASLTSPLAVYLFIAGDETRGPFWYPPSMMSEEYTHFCSVAYYRVGCAVLS